MPTGSKAVLVRARHAGLKTEVASEVTSVGDATVRCVLAKNEAFFVGEAAFEGVGLGVSLGSKVGVLGANGAGKSTLLKLMTAELTPTAGDATLAHATDCAMIVDAILSPSRNIELSDGPMKVMPSSSSVRGSAGFSDA